MIGTYVGNELTLELAADGSGALTFSGTRMPVRATIAGDALHGTFTADGNEFPFSARLEGGTLRLESGGATYVLARQAPAPAANPLARPAPPADGQIFRHPTGGEFRVPPGWTAQPGPGGIQLVPPGAAFGPTGPAEIYLVTGQPAPGIPSAGDPRVLSYLDLSLAQMIPGATRAGPPEPMGAGIRVRWSGRNAMTGGELAVVSMVTILGGIAVGVTGLGEPAKIAARLPALETVYASLRWGKGEVDPALVGVWHHWSWSGKSSSYGGGSHSAETRKVMQLGADGSARLRSSTESSVNLEGRDGYGNTAWTAGFAGQGGDERAGTWSAGGGMLYLIWQDGQTASWQYRVSGAPGDRRITMASPGDKPVEWTERPIQV